MLFTPPLPPLRTCIACVLALCAMVPLARAQSDATPAKPVATSAAPAGQTYKPKAGETLDQVIAKTMPSSPLSNTILRRAFMEQNPKAILAGKVPKLRKDATLIVPDHDQLLRSVMASVTPAAMSGPADLSPRPAPSSPEERKRWVKYP